MTNLVQLNEIFSIEYGNQLDRNKLKFNAEGINFVSRSEKNLGVEDKVDEIPGKPPYKAGMITVALGGSVLSSFVQPQPFYTAQNIKVLDARLDLSFKQKVFYCCAIKSNKFRYTSHGREANRTLDQILVPSPDDIPEFVAQIDFQQHQKSTLSIERKAYGEMHTKKWKQFRLGYLFDIKKGKRLTKENMNLGTTPFIGAIDSNNGYSNFISQAPRHTGNTITVNYNGSVGETFYQPNPFWASDDVNVLYPKFRLNKFIGLFIATIIRLERYKFNYGRKWRMDRMTESKIKLPVNLDGEPDWHFMEGYIKSLPYSYNLEDPKGE